MTLLSPVPSNLATSFDFPDINLFTFCCSISSSLEQIFFINLVYDMASLPAFNWLLHNHKLYDHRQHHYLCQRKEFGILCSTLWEKLVSKAKSISPMRPAASTGITMGPPRVEADWKLTRDELHLPEGDTFHSCDLRTQIMTFNLAQITINIQIIIPRGQIHYLEASKQCLMFLATIRFSS